MTADHRTTLVSLADFLADFGPKGADAIRAALAERDALQSSLDTINAEYCRTRETNQRLNARCQAYAAAIAEKIEKARAEYRSFGRMLANAAAVKCESERDALRAALAEALMMLRLADPARERTPGYRELAALLPAHEEASRS